MRVRQLVLVALGAGAVSSGVAASAGAAAPPSRCTDAPQTRTLCARVTVPLDRGGVVPGTVGLRVKLLPPVASGAGSTPVLALAGGPGQAAVPLLDAFASVLRPLLRTRDLVVFDQRGTGGSGRLRCDALATASGSLPAAVERCAGELGARRTAYTTAASVEDVEAVRTALGAERLIVFAASYGTKLALAYAAAYPQRVERLVLDSVVLPEGVDPFQRSTLAAIPRVMRAICRDRGCRFTRDPAADVAALAQRLAHGPLHGRALDGRGTPHRLRLTEADLLTLLLDGDFDRFVRAGLPAAVHDAAAGDPAPLLRIEARVAEAGAVTTSDDSDAVYVATTCQDGQVPWAAGTPTAARPAAVDAAFAAIAASAFLPFHAAAVRALGTTDLCRGWPESPIPQPVPPLPPTPTLILSGDADLRTPREDALGLAARLPGAQLLEVPDVSHGVVFSDLSGCAQRALAAFAAGSAVRACPDPGSAVPPLPAAPPRLAAVPRVRGVPPRAGRTVAATLLTLDDATTQLLAQLASSGRPRPFGGLRAGSASVSVGRGLLLRGYAYVPGVRVSGLIPVRDAPFALRVGGRAAVHGRLVVSRGGVTGVLGGVRVRLGPARLRAHAHAAAAAETAHHARALWPRGRRGVGLARGGG